MHVLLGLGNAVLTVVFVVLFIIALTWIEHRFSAKVAAGISAVFFGTLAAVGFTVGAWSTAFLLVFGAIAIPAMMLLGKPR